MTTPAPDDDGSRPAWAVDILLQLNRLNTLIPSHTDWTERNIKDHEVRIRKLENEASSNSWLPKLAWVIGTAVATYLVTTYLK